MNDQKQPLIKVMKDYMFKELGKAEDQQRPPNEVARKEGTELLTMPGLKELSGKEESKKPTPDRWEKL